MMKYFYVGIPAAIFGGELFLKKHVERNVQAGTEKRILGGMILVRKYHNKGACLDVGSAHSAAVAGLSLLLTSALTLGFAITLTGRGNGWMKASLSLLLGGAYSNTYDRLKRKYVVDYFSFPVKWKPLRRIVFNISDFCILIGALMVSLKGNMECRKR